jgi:hypothetical protein
VAVSVCARGDDVDPPEKTRTVTALDALNAVLAVPENCGRPLVKVEPFEGLLTVTVGVALPMPMDTLAVQEPPETVAPPFSVRDTFPVACPFETPLSVSDPPTQRSESGLLIDEEFVTVTGWPGGNGSCHVTVADWSSPAVIVTPPLLPVTEPPPVELYDHDGWPYFCSGFAPVKSPGWLQL